MQPRHPKLVSRGSEVADADLKFKGAPSDDCDPFAIQNYIDRLAAELFDSLHPRTPVEKGKDEWELMKEKAKGVPFHDITLSIALKHGLLEEVKKENANKPFEKECILAIMKVRDEFIQDYPSASSFKYQWQIWVEWERYLKQIGVTIPQWGKVARKLIRLGVELIQDDMARKYANQVPKRKSEDMGPTAPAERRRRLTLPLDPSSLPPPSSSMGGLSGYLDPAGPYGIASLSSMSPAGYGNPMAFAQHMGGAQVPMFGASLYSMIAAQSPLSGSLFPSHPHSTSTSPRGSTPSMMSPAPSPRMNMMSPSPSPGPSPAPSPIMMYVDPSPPYAGSSTLLPFPSSFAEAFVASSTSLPTHPIAQLPSASYPSSSMAPPQLSYSSFFQYSPPPSPSPPSSMASSPPSSMASSPSSSSMYSPISMSPMSTSPPSYNFVGENFTILN